MIKKFAAFVLLLCALFSLSGMPVAFAETDIPEDALITLQPEAAASAGMPVRRIPAGCRGRTAHLVDIYAVHAVAGLQAVHQGAQLIMPDPGGRAGDGRHLQPGPDGCR